MIPATTIPSNPALSLTVMEIPSRHTEHTQPDMVVPVTWDPLGEVIQDRAQYKADVQHHNRLTAASWKLVAQRTSHEFFLNAMMDKGAILSFFSILTFTPTVLALYSIVTLLLANNRTEVTALTADLINDYIPEDYADNVATVVDMIIGSARQGTIVLIVSVLIALFSSSTYVRAFARAANNVYGRLEGRPLIRTWAVMWFLTIIMTIGAAIIFVAIVLRRSVITRVLEPIAGPLGLTGTVNYLLDYFLPAWAWLRWPVILFIAVFLIAMLYHFAPNVRPTRFRWFTTGSLIALTGAIIAWILLRTYLTYFVALSAYGALGAAIAFLLALWIMNTFIVLGVKVDAEILRARELQRGVHAEAVIQAPPRSTKSAIIQWQQRVDLQEKGRTLRETQGRTLSVDEED